jgi:hypothetical protein|tara:strand:+ start:262 stop:456 length:195 start_codon:yes stop_codon:yes gene_type:complete
MEELKQYLKDLINDVYDEVDGGEERMIEVAEWDLYDDDRLIRDAGYIWGLEVALLKLQELTDNE